jgi:hypothetical protein
MQISFDVEGVPAEFRRNSQTGRAELRVGDDVICLQSPLRLSTHFDFRTRQVWRRRVGEHDIEIVKVRPRIYGGLRPSSFTISVDNNVAAEATGM